jgi:hypothetical protein
MAGFYVTECQRQISIRLVDDAHITPKWRAYKVLYAKRIYIQEIALDSCVSADLVIQTPQTIITPNVQNIFYYS